MAESNKAIAARLAGFEADQALGYAERENGDVVILGPDGKKYVFSPEKIAKAREKQARAKRAEAKPEPEKPEKPKASTAKRAPKK